MVCALKLWTPFRCTGCPPTVSGWRMGAIEPIATGSVDASGYPRTKWESSDDARPAATLSLRHLGKSMRCRRMKDPDFVVRRVNAFDQRVGLPAEGASHERVHTTPHSPSLGSPPAAASSASWAPSRVVPFGNVTAKARASAACSADGGLAPLGVTAGKRLKWESGRLRYT